MALRRLWGAILVLVAVLAVGCGGGKAPEGEKGGQAPAASGGGAASGQKPSAEEELYASARKEGKVVLYAAPTQRPTIDAIRKTWEQRYPGISIEMVEGTGSENNERILAEQRAGRVIADVIWSGDSTTHDLFEKEGYQAYDAEKIPNLQAIESRMRSLVTSHFFPVHLNFYGVVVNTKGLPEQDWPKRWADLADPKYKGKIALHDPRRSGGGNVFMQVGWQPLGRSFFERLAANDPLILARPNEVNSAVARGERVLGVPALSTVETTQEGAPIKWLAMQDGLFYVPIYAGIVKGAPHPNAAHLFLNFTLGREMQEAMIKTGNPSVRSDVEAPDNLSLRGKEFLGTGARTAEMIKKSDEYIQYAKEIFK